MSWKHALIRAATETAKAGAFALAAKQQPPQSKRRRKKGGCTPCQAIAEVDAAKERIRNGQWR